MALIKCEDCGREVSSSAPTCPGCGRAVAPTPSQNVSPMTAVLVIGAAIVGSVLYFSNVPLNRPTPASNALAVAGVPQVQAVPRKPSCAVIDFAADKVTYESAYGSVRIKGVIRHSCAVAAGVELKWTAYNKDGTVAFSDNFWPASTVNIQPNTPYPFTYSRSSSPQIARFEVAPVDTRVW